MTDEKQSTVDYEKDRDKASEPFEYMKRSQTFIAGADWAKHWCGDRELRLEEMVDSLVKDRVRLQKALKETIDWLEQISRIEFGYMHEVEPEVQHDLYTTMSQKLIQKIKTEL